MAGDELFGVLPDRAMPRADTRGAPRLREPVRDQIELRAVDIDGLIGQDHRARIFWGYVERVDLRELEDRIKARENTPGHPAISPRLMVALWLYATSEGVGSARALARLCESHDAYRWLCGGVSVNYHTLADFRIDCADLLDRLLTEHVLALAEAGIIDLAVLTQDGVRVRASAGAASFRRAATLEQRLAVAGAIVEELRREVDEHPDASNQRIKAAKERADRERVERIEAAQKALSEIEAQRERREETHGKPSKPQKEPRASTTDPDARVMKMADGGFRPAYNVQVVSAAEEQIVVDVAPCTAGSDRGLMRPRLEAVRERLGQQPGRYLVDGGFTAAADVEWAHAEGIAVHYPPMQSKHGTDPFQPRRDDGPGVLAWRARMASEAGKAQYKRRSICECIHARWRNWHLRQLTVRGLEKVAAVVLWYALANNILQGYRLATA
ncbi:MAG TPA: IS1182 family transposase [Stellaceae bacterium]|nr:IS1182 family transposase [Stellaceae bacterium]